MLAYHLSLLPWSCFASLTSGALNKETGAWYYVPRSSGWWVKASFGWLRGVARQQGLDIKKVRFVIRYEKSELHELLHVHLLLWTGRPWSIDDAMRANSLWRRSGNGTRHCTPYDASLAGASYVAKGLEYSALDGLEYELAKTGQTICCGGDLMLDLNTTQAIHGLLCHSRGRFVAYGQGGSVRTNAVPGQKSVYGRVWRQRNKVASRRLGRIEGVRTCHALTEVPGEVVPF